MKTTKWSDLQTAEIRPGSLSADSAPSVRQPPPGPFCRFHTQCVYHLIFIRDRFASLIQLTGLNLVLAVLDPLLILTGITAAASGLSALAMYLILRPVSSCLDMFKVGEKPSAQWTEKAGRRLINLPFISIVANVGMWIALPLIFFISASISEYINTRTAMIFSIRAFMVGLIASSIAFYKIESHARKKVISFFFPNERASEGKPPFAHGIGIHSGDVLAGNSGSNEQLAYALIGNTVNVASRIQGLTREL